MQHISTRRDLTVLAEREVLETVIDQSLLVSVSFCDACPEELVETVTDDSQNVQYFCITTYAMPSTFRSVLLDSVAQHNALDHVETILVATFDDVTLFIAKKLADARARLHAA